jgi:hypothetical protein
MKKLAIVSAIGTVLTACGSNPVAYQTQDPAAVYSAQVATQQHAVDNAPAWMSKLPKSPNAVYESASATSTDFGMADMKAKTMAYAKICTSAGGTIRSQMKMYKNDTDTASLESTELAVRSMCADVDISGVETVEMRHVAEGNRIRTYVLVALPTGSANVIKTTKDMQKRAPEAFRELDETVAPKQSTNPAPVSQVKGVDLGLLDVTNPDYRARRDAALQQPGAVIGHATLQ